MNTLTDEELLHIRDDQFFVTDFKSTGLELLKPIQIFQFCKANKRYKEPGISAHELRCLHHAVSLYDGMKANIVETGMCYGVSTRYFALRNLKWGGLHTTYEINVREPFKEDMISIGLWDRIIKRGHSIKDAYDGGDIDILFIDSEHAMADALGEYMRFRVWLHEGSLIGFHDTDCCVGVRDTIEVIKNMDDLELISESTGVYGAGIKFFALRGLGTKQKHNIS